MLCGQPEQKYGVRVARVPGSAVTAPGSSARSRSRPAAGSAPAPSTRASARATSSALERAALGAAAATVGVLLAEDERRIGTAVERLLDLRLDERELVLDDEHLVDAVQQLAHVALLERPWHAELHEPDARASQLALVEAEVVERAHAPR